MSTLLVVVFAVAISFNGFPDPPLQKAGTQIRVAASAIFALDDLPEKWRHYAEIEASYVVRGKFQADKFKK